MRRSGVSFLKLTMMQPVSRDILVLLDSNERRRAAWLMVLAFVGALAEIFGMGAILPFMRLLTSPEYILESAPLRFVYQFSGATSINAFLVIAASALLLLFLCKNGFLAFFYRSQSRFVSGVEARLASDLLAAYLATPYTARLERHSADCIRIITAEVGRATAGYLMPAITLITEGLVIAGIAGLLLWLQPSVAIVAALVVGASAFILQRILQRRLTLLREERVDSNTRMYKWASESLTALKEIKSLRREHYFVKHFRDNAQRYARATSEFTVLALAPRLIVENVAVTALLVALVAGIGAGLPLTELVPVLTLFGVAAVRIMPSATRVMSAMNSLRFYAPAVYAVADSLRPIHELQTNMAEQKLEMDQSGFEKWNEIILRNVSFRYPGSAQDSLCDVNLRIVRGQILGIVGHSGSGKTTFADLLLGLLKPDKGEILVDVDGLQNRLLTGKTRGVVGLVPQQFFLADDSVRRNVAFGREDDEIDDDRVWAALEGARLAARVRNMPEGLDTKIREQGAILSGGERQRLSIARSLYEGADILVLDEATSALDIATEAEIMETLRDLAATKAIVLITHRPSSMVACDRVVLMHEGHVSAEGTFDEVAALNPDFRKLISSEVARGGATQ